MAWFVLSLLFVIVFAHVPPLSVIGGILKYFGIPVAITWFMSQKTFDGKKPLGFYDPLSVIIYDLRSLLQEKVKEQKNDGMNPLP